MQTKNQNNMKGFDAHERRIMEQYNTIVRQLTAARFDEIDTFSLAMMLAGAALALKDEAFAEAMALDMPSSVLSFRTILRHVNPDLINKLTD